MAARIVTWQPQMLSMQAQTSIHIWLKNLLHKATVTVCRSSVCPLAMLYPFVRFYLTRILTYVTISLGLVAKNDRETQEHGNIERHLICQTHITNRFMQAYWAITACDIQSSQRTLYPPNDSSHHLSGIGYISRRCRRRQRIFSCRDSSQTEEGAELIKGRAIPGWYARHSS